MHYHRHIEQHRNKFPLSEKIYCCVRLETFYMTESGLKVDFSMKIYEVVVLGLFTFSLYMIHSNNNIYYLLVVNIRYIVIIIIIKTLVIMFLLIIFFSIRGYSDFFVLTRYYIGIVLLLYHK